MFKFCHLSQWWAFFFSNPARFITSACLTSFYNHPSPRASVYLPIHLTSNPGHIHPPIHPSTYPSIHLSLQSSIHPPIYPSIHINIQTFIYPSTHPFTQQIKVFTIFQGWWVHQWTQQTHLLPSQSLQLEGKQYQPNNPTDESLITNHSGRSPVL